MGSLPLRKRSRMLPPAIRTFAGVAATRLTENWRTARLATASSRGKRIRKTIICNGCILLTSHQLFRKDKLIISHGSTAVRQGSLLNAAAQGIRFPGPGQPHSKKRYHLV